MNNTIMRAAFAACLLACVAPGRACAWAQGDTSALPDNPSVEFALAGRPLGEIANTIRKASGVHVTVEPAIAGWKATIAYKGPLKALLRSLCSEFRLTLDEKLAQGASGQPAFEGFYLRLSDGERARLEKDRAEQDRKDRERRARDTKYMEDQINSLLHDKDPDGPHGVERGSPLATGSRPILDLLGSLGPDAIAQVAAGGGEPDEVGGSDPSLVVPMSSLSPTQRNMVSDFLNNWASSFEKDARGSRSPGADLLRDGMQHLDGGVLSLQTVTRGGAQMLNMSIRFGGMGGKGAGFPILVANSTTYAPPDRAKKEDIAAMPVSSPTPSEARRVTLDAPDADYGDAVLIVAKAAKLNVVADFFMLADRLSAYPKDSPLHEVLDRLCATFHAERRWEGGVILLREKRWEDRLPEEPPADVLDFLATTVKNQRLPSFAEIAKLAARLDRIQLRGLARWHKGPMDGRGIAADLATHGTLYAWCGSLPDEQIAQLQGDGVKVGALALKQRNGFARLAARRAGLAEVRPSASVHLRLDRGRYPPVTVLEVRDPASGLVSEIR